MNRRPILVYSAAVALLGAAVAIRFLLRDGPTRRRLEKLRARRNPATEQEEAQAETVAENAG